MIIVSWNIRGLNKSYKQREFKKFLLLNKVDLIACLETRVKQQSAKEIQRKVGVDWKFTDNYTYAPNGRIWIGWKVANVKVIVLDCSDQMIHCCVTDNNSSFSSYITFVYGLHTIHDRASLWRSLRNIQTNGPWLIIGDFNSVLHVDDRLNGIPVHQAETTDFQSCIDDFGVRQITKRGCKFSWSNKRDADIRIYSHIDWAFGNADWFQQYNGVEAIYMLSGCLGHSSIMITTEVNRVKVKKPFRLLYTVMKLQEYKEVVQNTWGQQIQGYTMYSIWRKLKLVEMQTRSLQQEHSSVDKKLFQLRETLKEVQGKLNEDHFNNSLIEEERRTLWLIEKWEAVQEQILRQKSRATWIKLGDCNSKYFHAYMEPDKQGTKLPASTMTNISKYHSLNIYNWSSLSFLAPTGYNSH
ncbi:PREDICTED: uncharacterized protein LOC109220841 [Nicotiana attenuata]|uniref:uncharacterized protein LOC109220841 n=1 Tax=Nicotiana attenuata TaxID=49451 RepID=UPI000905008D|nr:PREDICTED: uncharacterized protein LOC109220841 [Nicotiana attenuata]